MDLTGSDSEMGISHEALTAFLKLLRENGVSKFSDKRLNIEFASNSSLVPSSHKPGPTLSKQDELKEQEKLLFHSTQFA